MLAKNFTVKPSDERPARRDGTCFYCSQPIGGVHLPDCVIPQKSVVIKFSVELVCCEPQHFDRDHINFRYNEGSWCSDNLLEALAQLGARNGCLCNFITAEYLREATQEDQDAQRFEFCPDNHNCMVGKVVEIPEDED